MYLCGTKLDLIEDEIKERAVSKNSVEHFAKGGNLLILLRHV
jgi:hypothetical protein